MSWTDQTIAYLSQSDYVPLTAEDLSHKLAIPAAERAEFKKNLAQLLREGVILTVKKDRLVLPAAADLAIGYVKFRSSGTALFFPETRPGVAQPSALQPWQIRAEDTGVARHGDKVVVRRERSARPRYRQAVNRQGRRRAESDQTNGRVIRILSRSRTSLTGTLRKSRFCFYVVPDDPRFAQDIIVPDPTRAMLRPIPQTGDKVVVNLEEWETRHLSPEGEIVEVLGRSHQPGPELTGILRQYDLSIEFPPAVRAEAAALAPQVSEADRAGRVDLRHLSTVTIDPDDAKDFDDALSIERLANGALRIGVHIADVAHYVRPGSPLDREAIRRGNSTYLVGVVVPMLPEALSNGLCSLVEGADRLTKSVFLTFAAARRAPRVDFANSVIRSRKRLTYRQALAFLREDSLARIVRVRPPAGHLTGATGRPLDELAEETLLTLQKDLRDLWSVASQLRNKRIAAGSLDLDMPEVKIFTDPEGWAEKIERIEHDESHQLVEEFMLAANQALARHLSRAGRPLPYRVHDEPDADRLDELQAEMARFSIATGDLRHRKQVKALLDRIRDHPQSYYLRTQFLRSLRQACYRERADGHYGLHFAHYAHFTSPIRRYADLLLHRILADYLAGLPGAPAVDLGGSRYTVEQLGEICRHISGTEQNSSEAERDSVKIKLLEYFERDLARAQPSAFEAIITAVKNHGFFVELTESLAWGLVHVSTLQDDLYELDADGHRLIGRRHKRTFAVGQTIQVRVVKVDRVKRQIDFAVA